MSEKDFRDLGWWCSALHRSNNGQIGWVDFRDGIRAMRRKNGGYLVFVEEDYKGKSLVYRLEDPLESAKGTNAQRKPESHNP